MASSYESMPILYGRDASGELRHIDDVANGEACGCRCPDPHCGQPLIARNGGTKRIHHFAHKKGTCAWSAEYLISALACEVIRDAGSVWFPALSYSDSMEHRDVQLSEGLALRVADAALEEISGRLAPEVVVRIDTKGGASRSFVFVFSLVHALNSGQVEKIKVKRSDVVLVDFRRILRLRKREAGKHFDRERILAEFQSRDFLEWVLTSGESDCVQWVSNARAEASAAASATEYENWKREESKRRAAAEKERQRLRAGQRKQQESQRLRDEAKAKEEEEHRQREAAEAAKRDKAAVMELIKQQVTQARDSAGRRWIRCEICGDVKLENEFQSYGGAGRVNLGKCYRCVEAGRRGCSRD